MNWSYLKKEIYFEDGSLRDIYVCGVTRSDWAVWADIVNDNYKVCFCRGDIEEDRIDINKVFDYWERNNWDDEIFTASIYINQIRINVWFSEGEIENDIAPYEFKSMNEHWELLNYMTFVSKALQKKMILTWENIQDAELMAVDGERVMVVSNDNY